MPEIIFRGGVIVTVDPQSTVTDGDVVCRDGVIVQVGGQAMPSRDDYEILDCDGCIVMPGLVQSHVHMCQTLARGRADDLELLDWLRAVVWPYEAALSERDMAAAARLACAELLRGGTTAVLDMGTVRHTDVLFEVARDAGLRATIGKAMMDATDAGHPRGLTESTAESLAESTRLCQQWHGAAGGRLRYAFAPRFALSCTDALLREVAVAARQFGARIHTHSSENRAEIDLVRTTRGADNVVYLRDTGLCGPDVGLAHCVWLTDEEREVLRATGTHVLHCPSSNLKLASGIAHVPEMIDDGIAVSLGADGAPCNNNLDGFVEMRLAALIHKPRVGPRAMRAAQVVRMATMGGARALGLDHAIGSLEVNKRADVIAVDATGAHVAPTDNPYSALVYACRSTDVRHVVVDGAIVVRDRELLTLDAERTAAEARERARALFGRLE
ncbi:MAG: 5'-deoxyadenosine deaminase [Deltaproteobacteria bacterium]|nr:MAG: 5'-deoxyadenosine deaminase [Deltaproteobacteria bacterium]